MLVIHAAFRFELEETMTQPIRRICVAIGIFIALCQSTVLAQDDPLASWNDGAPKQAILGFVAKVTKEGSADYLPISQRIAVFDHDGTLWSEHPMYVQAEFTVDRLKSLAEQHPEWRETQPFQSVLQGNFAAVALSGEKGIHQILAATHSGMTADEFSEIVTAWLAKAQHPQFRRPYVECVYQPMLELLNFLRSNAFQTFVVSGGGEEFIRTFSEKTYGIPPQQVIGSTMKTRYELRKGTGVIMRLPELNFLCDGPGKPVEIQQTIGARPVMGFGNSDGDFEMLEYVTGGGGPRFAAIIHHTDAKREAAYDRFSIVGRLDRGLKEAPGHGWTVVDMKADWKQIFPSSVKP